MNPGAPEREGRRGWDPPEHRPLGPPNFLWQPVLQRDLEAHGSASEVLTAVHAYTHTRTHLHTDTQSLRGSYPRSKKSLPFHRGLLVHHFVAWPPCVFRGPCGPAAGRVPRHLAVPGLLPPHQLQGCPASSNPSGSSQTQSS